MTKLILALILGCVICGCAEREVKRDQLGNEIIEIDRGTKSTYYSQDSITTYMYDGTGGYDIYVIEDKTRNMLCYYFVSGMSCVEHKYE